MPLGFLSCGYSQEACGKNHCHHDFPFASHLQFPDTAQRQDQNCEIRYYVKDTTGYEPSIGVATVAAGYPLAMYT